MRRAALLALVVPAALAAGCSGGTTTPDAEPSGSSSASSASSPTTTDPGTSYSDWELGVNVLPTDASGFGVVRPTPRELRVRRFPTEDLLPPPEGGAFRSSVGPVTPAIRKRMGRTWSPACPVGLDGLRYVNVTFRGFDDRAHTGELVVAASEADDVVSVFASLYAADFPIEEMRLPTTVDLDAPPTGDGNNTAALVCRVARGTTTLSAHAYGLAIDINPFLNPYVKGDLVLPERASAYLVRTRTQPGIIHAGDLVVREFARIGWTWGGAWRSLKDYQHFSATGG